METENVLKYVAKTYNKKHGWKYTVVLPKARRFDTEELAQKYIDSRGIKNVVQIASVVYELTLKNYGRIRRILICQWI